MIEIEFIDRTRGGEVPIFNLRTESIDDCPIPRVGEEVILKLPLRNVFKGGVVDVTYIFAVTR